MHLQRADLAHVGDVAFTAGVELHELSKQGFDLEELFFRLTTGEFSAEQMGPAQQ